MTEINKIIQAPNPDKMEQHNIPATGTRNWLKEENTIQYFAKVKPYNLQELCYLYETSGKTFKRWLLPFQHLVGPKNGRYYSVLQVEIIFAKLGVPYEIK